LAIGHSYAGFRRDDKNRGMRAAMKKLTPLGWWPWPRPARRIPNTQDPISNRDVFEMGVEKP